MATLDLRAVLTALARAISDGVNNPTLLVTETSDDLLTEDTANVRANTTATPDPASRTVACYDLIPPSTPQFPCVIVRPADQFVAYHRSFGTDVLCDVQVEVLVMHQGTTDIDSQIVVLDLLSAGTGRVNSVIDAISVDRTLGGAVANVIVTEASGLSRVAATDGSEAVQASLQVLIRLRR